MLSMNILKKEDIDIKLSLNVEIISQISVDEKLLLEKVRGNAQEMLTVACQIAIVGVGGNSYDEYFYDGEARDMKTFFHENDICYTSNLNDKLSSDQLTPRRLCRLFRYHIKDVIESKNYDSYLYRKYTDHNPMYRSTCFAGSEYLATGTAAAYLLKAYENLDMELSKNGKSHGLATRVKRILQARGEMPRQEAE